MGFLDRFEQTKRVATKGAMVGLLTISSNAQVDSCYSDGSAIYCKDFKIDRPFGQVGNVYDIKPVIGSWRSLSDWKNAIFHSWTDGLNYMIDNGCVLSELPDDKLLETTRRVRMETPCLPSIDQNFVNQPYQPFSSSGFLVSSKTD